MTKPVVYYAGIGGRKTPKDACSVMTKLGMWMAEQGYVLRSGAAEGADESFEKGCDFGGGDKQIFLPWNGFRGRYGNERGVFFLKTPEEAVEIAKRYHPKWKALNRKARQFHTRNVSQILGPSLNVPSRLVICWTEEGKVCGGTGQALRMALDLDIPILNLGDPFWANRGYDFMMPEMEDNILEKLGNARNQ